MSVPVYRDSLQGDRVPTQPGLRDPARMSNAFDLTLAALRIVAGLMLVQHGVQKHFGLLLPPGSAFAAPEPFSQMWIAGTLEIGGGILFAIGFLTRPVAFLLAGFMASAYFTVHAPRSLWPVLNDGELAALYCFVFLAFVGTGGGRYSVDGLIVRRLGRRRLEGWDPRVLGPTRRIIRRGKTRV